MEKQNAKNQKLIDGLQGAVSSLFNTMIGLEPLYKEGTEADTFSLSADVAGIMYIQADPPGMVACGAPTVLARSIIGKMTGIAEAELEEGDISDGLAEMVNMLCGHIKTQLPELCINLTPPLSLIGRESKVCWKTAHPSIVLRFDISGSELTVAAAL